MLRERSLRHLLRGMRRMRRMLVYLLLLRLGLLRLLIWWPLAVEQLNMLALLVNGTRNVRGERLRNCGRMAYRLVSAWG